MARKEYKKEIKTKRLFVTGSSYSGDTILTSSFNEMSKSFANNDYLGPDGINTSGVGGLVYMMNEMKDDIDDIHSEISSSVYVSQVNSGSFISQIRTFTSRDTTPSVNGGTIFKTNNDRPITITTFDDGVDGQRITILISDSNTNFTHDIRALTLNGATNWTAAASGDSIEFIFNGTAWIETNRSDNT
jgi:hypothetical protein